MSPTPALVAVTRRGAERARRLAGEWPQAVVYLHKSWDDAPGAAVLEPPLRQRMAELLARHDPVVFFCALGAVVRLIAPHLRSKREDPAVLAVDEAARFVIPVVSGHLGGANGWAETLARRLGAVAVITTASEGLGLPAVDLLGREWGWRVEATPAALTRAAAALVNGEPVALVQECGDRRWRESLAAWPAHLEELPDPSRADPERHRALLWISRRPLEESLARCWPDALVRYRPPGLAVGMGCDRGTSLATLEAGLALALGGAGFGREEIATLATIDRKGDEPALLALAADLGFSLRLYTPDTLARVPVPNPSSRVQEQVGSPSVAEAAALLAAGGNGAHLLVPKFRHRGADGRNVTVAMARVISEGA